MSDHSSVRRAGGQSLLILLCAGLIQGCAEYAAAGASMDRVDDVRTLVQQEAAADFSCPSVQITKPVRQVHERDWEDGLFSEYLVHAEGCQRWGNYRVTCREGGLCAVAE